MPGSSVHGISQARILEWLPFPAPGDLPDPGIEPASPALQVDSLLLSHQGSPPTRYFTEPNMLSRKRQWHPTPVLLPGRSHGRRSLVGCSPWGHEESDRTRLSDFTFTFHFHALEKEMATHSSVLSWRIPGMREPGGLLSMGSQRVGHD